MGNLLGVGILKTRETCTAVVVNGDQSQLVMLSGILQQDGLQVTSCQNPEDALARARDATGPFVVVIDTDPYPSTPHGGNWWDVAVPEVSERAEVNDARKVYEAALLERT